jgi:putative tryptophan/tyrosine transport system substrate-binding protein
MRRVVLVVVLLLSLMPAPLAGEAQGKVYRIGWLSPASSATGAAQLEALRKGLAELGYFEGRNIAIEGRWADGDATRLPRLARALVELRVDIICSFGTPATLAAKRATTTIPIVFGQAAFPEQSGIVTSLARPGGNLTGIAFIGPEYGKRLELLREMSPKTSRVVVLYNDQNIASVLAMTETQKWARTLQITIDPLGAHDRASLDAAFDTIRRGTPDALMTTADPMLQSHRALIVEFAAGRRLPSMYGDQDYVTAGGLMFYGASTTAMWRHAAIYVDRILKGAKPGTLPVEQPTNFDLVINMKTAKALGLTIPQTLLLRATQVIE